MTHRSRTFAPAKTKRAPGQPKKAPKLHHPPPPPAASGPAATSIELPAYLSSPLDQEILNVLRASLRGTIDQPDFVDTVQTIKGLLYDRKWLDVFTDGRLLKAYTGRWVPSRALCYRTLLGGLAEIRAVLGMQGGEDGSGRDESDSDGEDGDGDTQATTPTHAESSRTRHVLSIGGGAGSEQLALAALAHGARSPSSSTPAWQWTGVDIGAWTGVVDALATAVQSAWHLDADAFATVYLQTDVLAAPPPLPTPPDLTTILFTLTELLAQSKAQTIAFLAHLTRATRPGSLLLLADSASDIAEFALGDSGRTWPVYFVADALLDGRGWAKVASEDSAWFRLEPGTGRTWPCKLENVRYWMRLYRRV